MTLAARDLSVAKRGVPILGPVDLALEPGRITAICGPNGAGKSTLLAALAGLEPLASGTVALDGTGLHAIHPRDRARAIGFLPQDGEVAWDVSVRNLVALGRIPHRDMADGPAERALAALDLRDLADRPISSLSGGEQARALLARVLAGEPRWILADEPLAALDIAHQLAMIGTLRAAACAGAGVVLVVHDLALAMNNADRVVVLDNGRIAADGPPDEALSQTMLSAVWNVAACWVGPQEARALSIAAEP